jgi:hypothetical protein
MAEQIRFIIPYGVISFHWDGPGALKVHTQFKNKNEAIEVFARLREEMDLILDTLSMNLDPAGMLDRFDTVPSAPPSYSPGSSPPPFPSTHFASSRVPLTQEQALAAVQQDPRLVARQRPTSGSGELNYSKLPPRAALSAAQKLAEDQVAAYARAQGRGSDPAAPQEPIELPQAKRVEMKAEVKPPTHEEALVEARRFIDAQRAAMGLAPMKAEDVKSFRGPDPYPLEPEAQILPPPPPPESKVAVEEDLGKSS